MRVPLVALAGIAACGEPSIRVEVLVPDAWRDDIAATLLSVYESDLSCSSIAFGDADEDALTAAPTIQVDVGDGAPLTGISRLDHKLLVARGRNEADELVVAGCAELGAVEGDVTVAVETTPVAVVTVVQGAIGQPLGDTTRPANEVGLSLDDPRGDPLLDRVAVWRMFGPRGTPGGAGTPGCSLPDVDGCVTMLTTRDERLRLEAPFDAGPHIAEIRVEWARVQPDPVMGFRQPEMWGFCLDGLARPDSCVAIADGGRDIIACLARSAAGTVEVRRYGWSAGSIAQLPGSLEVPDAFALVAEGSAGWVVTTDGTWRDPVSGQKAMTTDLSGRSPTQLVQVTGCGSAPVALIQLNDLDDMTDVRASPLGGGVTSFFPPQPKGSRLVAAGCIAGDDGKTIYRAAVFVEGGRAEVLIDCGRASLCQSSWTPFGAVGFVETGRADDPAARLISGDLGVAGAVVTSWIYDPERKRPVQPETIDTVAPPRALASGDIDGDGELDLLWLAANDEARTRVQMALGARGKSGRIVGVSPLFAPVSTRVFTARIDDDEIDDVVLQGGGELLVLLMGRASPGPRKGTPCKQTQTSAIRAPRITP